jgi:hypothetical protein
MLLCALPPPPTWYCVNQKLWAQFLQEQETKGSFKEECDVRLSDDTSLHTPTNVNKNGIANFYGGTSSIIL